MIDNRREQEREALEKLMNEANLYAKYSIKQTGKIPPTLLIHGEDGVTMFGAKALSDDRSKERFVNFAKLACIATNADATVFVSEAWMKTARHGEKLDVSRSPSSYPDREEVAIMMGQTRTSGQQRVLPMIRSSDGKFMGFGNENRINADRIEGRFTNFIPWEYPPLEMRAVARAALDKLGVQIGNREERQENRQERGRGQERKL
jgi:hypothetical protein